VIFIYFFSFILLSFLLSFFLFNCFLFLSLFNHLTCPIKHQEYYGKVGLVGRSERWLGYLQTSGECKYKNKLMLFLSVFSLSLDASLPFSGLPLYLSVKAL
jgi:hypothetical protein